MTRSLDGSGQHTLVLGTCACLAAGPDLASFGHKLLQLIDLLVGDSRTFVAQTPRATTRGPAASPAESPVTGSPTR